LTVAEGVKVGRLVNVSVGVNVRVDVRVMVFVEVGVSVNVGGTGEAVRVGAGVGLGSALTGAAIDPRSQAIKRMVGTRSRLRLFIGKILSDHFKSLAKAV
jgi:hypothetical protein